MIEDRIQRVEQGADLSFDEMAEAIGQIMSGEIDQDHIAQLLAGLHRKGETADEVAGAALAMRRHMTPIRRQSSDSGSEGAAGRPASDALLDVVGTGGDGSGTLNISTAAALVTAACGVVVAKHGNRAVTSRSGASDVLAHLGVNIEADLATVERCLAALGICFCFAPLYHRAMKSVAPVRKSLPHPTVFNLLGPLANPASAGYQLLGVGREELRPLMARAVRRLEEDSAGLEPGSAPPPEDVQSRKSGRAVVVHGSDGLDEVTLGGRTDVTVVTPDGLSELSWTAEDFGLPAVAIPQLQVRGPEESAQRIRDLLDGKPGPCRDVVLANAAAALWVVGRVASVGQGVGVAAEAVDSGAAAEKLARLVEMTNAAG